MNKKALIILVIAALCLAFVQMCLNIKFIQDDAFTSFRYAKNLIEGKGLVFNSGEYVEGYTNFLWVMIISLLSLFNIDIITASQLLSVLLSVLILPVVYFISKQFRIKSGSVFFDELVNIVPIILLCFTGGFQYWSVSAMETSLFSLLILTSVFSYLKKIKNNSNSITYVLLLLVASFTRPEGLAVFMLIFIHRAGSYLFNNKERNFFFRLSGLITSNLKNEFFLYFIPLTLYILFRLFYYGYLFPNTYYAKTSYEPYYFIRGLEYLWKSISSYFLFGLMLLLPFVLLTSRSQRKLVMPVLYLSFTYLALVAFIGGDVLPFHRFVLPVLPLVYILFLKSFYYLFIKSFGVPCKLSGKLTIGFLLILVTAYSVQSYYTELPEINNRREYEIGLVAKMKFYAEWVNERMAGSDRELTVCLSTIGAFSYYSDANVIDLIGLTDEFIAHNPVEVRGIAENVSVLWTERRYNVDYVLSREPDYFIFPAGAKPSAYPESALFSKEKFIKNYYPLLVYSQELNQFLPVFSKRPAEYTSPESSENDSCSVKFVGHFVQATTDFMRFLRTGRLSLLDKIEDDCSKVIDYCPAVETYALTTLGYAYYHSGRIDEAEAMFDRAVALDDYNCPAHLYLIKISQLNLEWEKRKIHFDALKKYSPYAFPTVVEADSLKF
ncbi:MAG: tetratricopeptide repeat protein [Melioribacteraceae bacterium]|nr:tetratricopeptide repeat protein [Melioribacteraceae bacterium]